MPFERNKDEIGAGWTKTSARGDDFISVSLDMDRLLDLTGGATGKVTLSLFPVEGEKTNPKAPDYRLKFFVRSSDSEQRPRQAPPLPIEDDDIPF